MYGFFTSLASSSCIVICAFTLIESTSKLSTLNTGATNSGRSCTIDSVPPPFTCPFEEVPSPTPVVPSVPTVPSPVWTLPPCPAVPEDPSFPPLFAFWVACSASCASTWFCNIPSISFRSLFSSSDCSWISTLSSESITILARFILVSPFLLTVLLCRFISILSGNFIFTLLEIVWYIISWLYIFITWLSKYSNSK